VRWIKRSSLPRKKRLRNLNWPDPKASFERAIFRPYNSPRSVKSCSVIDSTGYLSSAADALNFSVLCQVIEPVFKTFDKKDDISVFKKI
jgi:hypothetical protein